MNVREYLRQAIQAVFAGAFIASVGCQPEKTQAEWWQGERERVELEQELALKAYRLSQSQGDEMTSYRDLQDSAREGKVALSSLRLRRDQLSGEVAAFEGKRIQFRDTLIQEQRQRVIGKTFDKLKLATGREYEKVVVAQIDDAGVTVRHPAGSVRIGFNDLDVGQQAFFGLDPDLAMAANTRERRESAAYDEWISGQLLAIQEAGDSQAGAANHSFARNDRKYSSRLAREAAISRERPLAQSASYVGGRSSRGGRGVTFYQVYRPVYRYGYGSSCGSDGSPRYAVRSGVSPVQSNRGGPGCSSVAEPLRTRNTAPSVIPSEP